MGTRVGWGPGGDNPHHTLLQEHPCAGIGGTGRAAPGAPKTRAWRKGEGHGCSLPHTPAAPGSELWDAKPHWRERRGAAPAGSRPFGLALPGHRQPRQRRAIASGLEIAPTRALSWGAERSRVQTAVSYQRQLKKDIPHTCGVFFPPFFFFVCFVLLVFFPRIKSTQQPPLQLPF